MKILLTLFFLLFSFSVFADDIRDFQIEGISVGDSLLDYFSDEEIKDNIIDYDKDNSNRKFFDIEFYKHLNFEVYDAVQFAVKLNDSKYIIYAIDGATFVNNISDCYSKVEKVENEISNIFINAERFKQEIVKHPADSSGKSTSGGVAYLLEDKGSVSIRCYDWSKELPYTDNFRISIRTKEYRDWL